MSQEATHSLRIAVEEAQLLLAEHNAKVLKEAMMVSEAVGHGGRQSASRLLWEQAERYERKAKALRMLGNMIEDLPRDPEQEDLIEPALWELLVGVRWG